MRPNYSGVGLGNVENRVDFGGHSYGELHCVWAVF